MKITTLSTPWTAPLRSTPSQAQSSPEPEDSLIEHWKRDERQLNLCLGVGAGVMAAATTTAAVMNGANALQAVFAGAFGAGVGGVAGALVYATVLNNLF